MYHLCLDNTEKIKFIRIDEPAMLSNQWMAPVWPDWAIYWTLGNILKPLATIDLPKSLTFLGNFCIGVKSYHFSSEIILGQFL